MHARDAAQVPVDPCSEPGLRDLRPLSVLTQCMRMLTSAWAHAVALSRHPLTLTKVHDGNCPYGSSLGRHPFCKFSALRGRLMCRFRSLGNSSVWTVNSACLRKVSIPSVLVHAYTYGGMNSRHAAPLMP